MKNKQDTFTNIDELLNFNFDSVEVNEEWNYDNQPEELMHKIHTYPAKFPSFIAKKSFEYAKERNQNLNVICDIFCGCGTVALEAQKNNLNFIGFDINPVAVMISKAKSGTYDVNKIIKYNEQIIELYNASNVNQKEYENANERLKYWFFEYQFIELLKIKNAIKNIVNDENYLNLFLCIFSNSLKRCSKWLSKSIKPQIDVKKKCAEPLKEYLMNYRKTLRAITQMVENNIYNSAANIDIKYQNFLNNNMYFDEVDMIITSPPYVTSYEYADLHQLSSLWLDFSDKYTDLRKGSIGSLYNTKEYIVNIEKLSKTALNIINELFNVKISVSKIKSIARYFEEMMIAIINCKKILKKDGRIVFVIGDTDYKTVRIQNAKFLCEILLKNNFVIEMISRRKISNKYLTPYRDENGKFSNKKDGREIYSKEFVIIGRKK